MECKRCHGFMVTDHFLDIQESFGTPWIKGWRCVTCGEISDPIIERNRQLQLAGKYVKDKVLVADPNVVPDSLAAIA